MTRAIPVDRDFDPVPSLVSVRAIDVNVTPDMPSDVGILADLVSTTSPGTDQAELKSIGFTGARGDVHIVAGSPATVLIGIGAVPIGLASGRDIGAAVAGAIPGALDVAVDVGDVDAEVVEVIVQGIILARYSWDALRAEPARTQVKSIILVSTSDAVTAGARRRVRIDARVA